MPPRSAREGSLAARGRRRNARVVCPRDALEVVRRAGELFEPKNNVSKSAAAAAGAAGGGLIGAGWGLASGGIGLPATVPAAIVGGVIGWLGADKFVKCSKCGKVFKR